MYTAFLIFRPPKAVWASKKKNPGLGHIRRMWEISAQTQDCEENGYDPRIEEYTGTQPI